MRWIRAEIEKNISYLAEVSRGEWELLEGKPWSSFSLTGIKARPEKILPPVDPVQIIGIGQNYRKHAEEMGSEIPERPVVFLKMAGTVTGHKESIQLPRHLKSDQVDSEAELAVILGKTVKNVEVEDALQSVLGYTCANDVSARDWQRMWGGGQFCRGKGFDGFCPLGPVVVDPSEIPDPQNLQIEGILNGEVVQRSSTSDMIFSVAELISFLSGSTTLPAGTVILTGTPSGVGAGRNPPRFHQAGDQYEVRIPPIGSLVNSFLEELI